MNIRICKIPNCTWNFTITFENNLIYSKAYIFQKPLCDNPIYNYIASSLLFYSHILPPNIPTGHRYNFESDKRTLRT